MYKHIVREANYHIQGIVTLTHNFVFLRPQNSHYAQDRKFTCFH